MLHARDRQGEKLLMIVALIYFYVVQRNTTRILNINMHRQGCCVLYSSK
jgi:hypothetical protein